MAKINFPELHKGQKEVFTHPAKFKVLACGRRWGKALSLDTPILTTVGWSTMRDIQVGDYVFGQDGKPTKVVACTNPMLNHDVYELTFSDGSKIKADAGHQWYVESDLYRKRKSPNSKMIYTTEEMYIEGVRRKRKDNRVDHRFAIPVSQPLQMDVKDYLFDPYSLGVWLGDGCSTSSYLTVLEQEIIDNFAYDLHQLKDKKNWSFADGDSYYRNILKELKVFDNKHIPEDYFLGSFDQRLALLQGLMDTDGYCSKLGYCEFTSTNKQLANDVLRLVLTLGIKATQIEGDATIDGRFISKKYRVKFTTTLIVFRLGYKVARQKTKVKSDVTRRFITDIRLIPSEPVKCIEVDNSNHLFLAGESLIPTHNSFLAKQMALTRAIEQGQNVWLLYPTYKTALPHWREFTRMFNRDLPFVTYMSQQDKMIEFKGGGRVTIKSTDQPNNLRGDGLDFALLDEASFMQQQVWYEVVFPALADKGGDAIFISTPYGKGNWFYQLFIKGIGDDPEPNWKSWRMPTRSNPHIDRTFLKEMKKDMPYHIYQQEVLANFTDNAGGVFNGLDKVCTGKKLDDPVLNDVYIFGIDWGRKNDYTVISVFNRYTGEQVDLIRFSDIDYQRQLSLVERAYQKWKPIRIIAEENNMGQVLVEQLKKDLAKYDVKLKPVYMTNIMKRALVEGLAIAIDKERVTLLNYAESDEARAQYEELSAYELKRTAGGTQVTYSSPRSGHDDTVVATMLAVSDLKNKHRSDTTFRTTVNPFY